MKKIIISTALLLILTSPLQAAMRKQSPWQPKSWKPFSGQCQILDKPKPAYSAGMGFIPTSDFDNFGDSAFFELDADWEFGYFRDVLYGDMDLNLIFRDTMFMDDADLNLPGLVAILGVDIGWTWRYADGFSFQARVHPGLYGDLKEVGIESVFIPFSGSCIYSFSPYVSGRAGLQFRPSWELVIMPLIGVEWEICDELRLEAGIPSSRLIWYINRDWQTYISFKWNNITYKVDESYDKITIEDIRTVIGASYDLNGQVRVIGEIGSVSGRSIEFDNGDNGDIDIDSSTVLRIGIGGPL